MAIDATAGKESEPVEAKIDHFHAAVFKGE